MNMLEIAVDLVNRGFAVFPLQPRGKQPLGGHGFKDASRDMALVRRWWTASPEANVGIATGSISQCWVLDVDNKPGAIGYDALMELEQRHGERAWQSAGIIVTTPTNGLHLYFAWDDMRPVRNTTSKIGKGIDTRGDGGYVVAPGSVRDDGEYVMVEDGLLMDAPEWLMAAMAEKPRPAPVAVPIPSGSGDVAEARAALDRLSVARVDVYDDWVQVGMALRSLGDVGLPMWDAWSRRSPKYRQGECEAKWKTFDTEGIKLGTLFHWASIDSPRAMQTERRSYESIINRGL